MAERKKLEFRALNASEVECRVQTVTQNGCMLLIYKDARVDQKLLDEVVGPMNWQRVHSRDNANCTVSIWDEEKSQWVSKEDTGKESNNESQKGLASDSFKRACTNWGIGRELYTAPHIWIRAQECEIKPDGRDRNGKDKYKCYTDFDVDKIETDETKTIVGIRIVNARTRAIVFSWGTLAGRTQTTRQEQPKQTTRKSGTAKITAEQLNHLQELIQKRNVPVQDVLRYYNADSFEKFTNIMYEDAVNIIKANYQEVA